MTPTTLERATACLKGVAVGDAIGKQTEMLATGDVARWYPRGIHGFEGTPGAVVPRYAGSRKREWRVGETTDDTERTLAVARAILADRGASHVGIGRELLECRKCIHPGIRSLWEFHQAGDPGRIASAHDGCGAAVRVAPVGIVYTPDAIDDLVSGAREASISTHGGSLAIAAAAATAAAVSAAVEGRSGREVLELAERAAGRAERRWPGSSGPAFAHAIRAVHDEIAGLPVRSAAAVAGRCFPDRPLTIVPLALALAALMTSAQDAILLAANIAGDSDSVASIAGGILGARYPDSVNEGWYRIVESVNRHDMISMASSLVRLRGAVRPVNS